MSVKTLKDKDFLQLLPFFENVRYNKFNRWGINHLSYLNYVIESSTKSGEVFVYKINNKIIAILAFSLSPWDTNFYNINAGKINALWVDSTINEQISEKAVRALLQAFQNFAYTIKLNFCFVSLGSWSNMISRVIQENGFKYILSWADCYIGKRSMLKLPEGYNIGEIHPYEVEYIAHLARDYFKGGRFYLDGNFPKDKVDQMYYELIMNSWKDPSCELAVLRNNENPVGAFICKSIKYPFSIEFIVRSLRLLVFDKDKSVPGLATAYIGEVANYLYAKYKCNLVVSGVEIHNLPSLIIHSKAGYKFNYTHNAYHWWANY